MPTEEVPTRDLVIAETRRALEAAFTPERSAWLLRAIEIAWPPVPLPPVKLKRGAPRTVNVSRFEMSGTYEGVLEGVPHHEPILAAAKQAYDGIPVFLVPPPLRRLEGYTSGERFILPSWRCAAVLRSFEAVDPGSDYSLLRVAWFRDDADPLFPVDAVEDLDWERLAHDFEY
jgi:hypothetical protein